MPKSDRPSLFGRAGTDRCLAPVCDNVKRHSSAALSQGNSRSWYDPGRAHLLGQLSVAVRWQQSPVQPKSKYLSWLSAVYGSASERTFDSTHQWHSYSQCSVIAASKRILFFVRRFRPRTRWWVA